MKKLIFYSHLIIVKKKSQLEIYSPEKSVLYCFNNSAYFIIRELFKNRKKIKIITNLKKKYNISFTKAKKDYNLFINDLKKKDLIIPYKGI